MNKFIISISLLFSSLCFSYQYDLSICTIFRDEAPYLKEWIEFHRILGVQHFYLCSHCSKDNYREVLEPYIRDGIVELKEISDIPDANIYQFCFGIQIQWFNETLLKTKGVSKWIAFIDSDEFLFPSNRDSLVEFLKDYESCVLVTAYWQMFGTSNIKKLRSDNLLIEQLVRCSRKDHSYNTLFKTIARPDFVELFPNPHLVNMYSNSIYMQFQPDQLRINHYWTRDEDYFLNIKIPRQAQLGGNIENAFHLHSEFNQEEDLAIQRFVPALRKRMGLD